MTFSQSLYLLLLVAMTSLARVDALTSQSAADVTLTESADETKMVRIVSMMNFTFPVQSLRFLPEEQQRDSIESFARVPQWILGDGVDCLYVHHNDDVTAAAAGDVTWAVMRICDDFTVEGGLFVVKGSGDFVLKWAMMAEEDSDQGSGDSDSDSYLPAAVGGYVIEKDEDGGPQCGAIGHPLYKEDSYAGDGKRMHRRFADVRRHQTPEEMDEMFSRQHFIEIAAYVDEKTAAHYGDRLNDYITQVIAGANLLYHRPLLQVKIILSLLKIQVIHEHDLHLRFGNNTDSDFAKFCHWQAHDNPMLDTDPGHHDLALLFTKQTVQLAKGKSLEGVAPVGEICKLGGACAVIKSSDNLSKMIFTTAHEIGHLLNMIHDEEPLCFEHNQRSTYNDKTHTLMYSAMTTFFTQVQSQHPWSKCNVRFLENFIGNGNGKCLYDVPQNPMINRHNRFPGEVFNGTEQCQMIFGNGSRDCPKYKQQHFEYCKVIQCEIPDKLLCEALRYHRPDGTRCGPRRQMCFAGQCIDKRSRPRQIAGSWSSWSAYGKCSRSCDGGVKRSTRRCDNPEPQFGGQTCIGASERYRTCNRKACDREWGRRDFRLEQCNRLFRAKIYSMFTSGARLYEPQYFHLEPHQVCQLFCRKRNKGTSYLFRYQVDDGTRCTSDSTDVCISGRCEQTGCDGVFGSDRKLNRCGVCADGAEMCDRQQGREIYTVKNATGSESVPKSWYLATGTTNIKITKRGSAGSLILKDTDGNVLKNLTQITTNSKMVYFGTTLHLEVESDTDGSYQAVRIPWTLQRVLFVDLSMNSNSTADEVVVEYSYHFANYDMKKTPSTPQVSSESAATALATTIGTTGSSTTSGLFGIEASFQPTTTGALHMSKKPYHLDTTQCGHVCDFFHIRCNAGSWLQTICKRMEYYTSYTTYAK